MTRTKVFAMVLAIFILAGCVYELSTAPSPTESAIHQPIGTSSPQPSETATWTPTPTATPSLAPTITWTPLPILSAQQAPAKIQDLLDTNGGCELPCWWGITPSETTWLEALHFLSPFILDLEQSDPYTRVEDGESHTYQEIQFYYKLPGNAPNGRMTLGVKDGIVFGMTVYPLGAEFKYQLHQLLALLGPPKQVLVNAQSSSPISELPPTVLALDYSDIGVWALYGYTPNQERENLVVCPKSSLGRVSIYDNLGGRLHLFDPKTENSNTLTFEEYANTVGGFTAKKLEDVTNMTVESFYNTFIDPQSKACLETPADLWP